MQKPLKSPSLDSSNSKWDAIVIGSGIGGMACAAALAKYQKRVLILEQHYTPGGYTHTFSRKGFTWDVGVHCLGEMGPKDIPGQILNWLSDGELEMNSMGPIYETFYFPDQFKITFPNSRHEFKNQLISTFPIEKQAIEEYFKLIFQVTQSAKLYFALKAMPEWIDTIAQKTIYKQGSRFWKKTTAEVLDELTSNHKLKTVLTGQWGYYGNIPTESSFAIHALTVRHFWNGGYYPVHGSKSFSDCLLKPVIKAGGEIKLRTMAEEIIINQEKAIGVRTAQGDTFFASHVISAVGAKNTVQRLLPKKYQTSKWGEDIVSIPQSPSYICLNIGFEGNILDAGATASNQWFFETWSNDEPLWNVSDLNSFAPILYLSFPTLKDPAHNPGINKRHTAEVVTFVPWSSFEKWKNTRRGNRDPEYLKFKKTIEDRLLLQLKKYIPKLLDLMVYHELSTPLSTLFFTQNPQGAIYGLEATPRRFASKSLRTRTPVQNLYLTGADVATLGVAGALMGGILTAGTINPKVFSKLVFGSKNPTIDFLKFAFERSQ